MIWIEFLGGVGSGKSSLANALKERLQADGFAVCSPQQAVADRLAGILPRTLRADRAVRAAKKVMRAGWQVGFAVRHPALIRQVMQANRALQTLPDWHRKIIRDLFFEVGGWYEGLAGRSNPQQVVLVDEGLAHRAVNLFAWRPGAVDRHALRAYLACLPPVPLTIIVHAPINDCIQRAATRGLPARLRGKDPVEVQRFLQNSHTVAALSGEILASLGRPVIEIDNGMEFEQAADALYSMVMDSGLFRPSTMGQVRLAKELTQ